MFESVALKLWFRGYLQLSANQISHNIDVSSRTCLQTLTSQLICSELLPVVFNYWNHGLNTFRVIQWLRGKFNSYIFILSPIKWLRNIPTKSWKANHGRFFVYNSIPSCRSVIQCVFVYERPKFLLAKMQHCVSFVFTLCRPTALTTVDEVIHKIKSNPEKRCFLYFITSLQANGESWCPDCRKCRLIHL